MTTRTRTLLTAVLCQVSATIALAQATPTQQGTNPSVNPNSLRATQVLERRAPGTQARVRFEWDQVSGAQAYVLLGRWTQPPSWTIRSRDLRVTRRNASAWTDSIVAYDVALPAGSHSWKVVAVPGTRSAVDTAHAASLSFEVR